MCVCQFTAGITGQGCLRSEARRQLVEWDARVAGGCKVSSMRLSCPPLTLSGLCCALTYLWSRDKNKASGPTKGKKATKMPRAQR